MSTPYSPTPLTLHVEIKPSNYFHATLISIALIAVAAILYAQLAWSLHLILLIAAAVYTGYCWRAQRRQRGVLQWRSLWFWRGSDGVEHTLRLRHATVWPGLIVLIFSDTNSRDNERKQKFVLTLFADSFVTADEARRLRVHLNHFPVFDSADVLD